MTSHQVSGAGRAAVISRQTLRTVALLVVCLLAQISTSAAVGAEFSTGSQDCALPVGTTSLSTPEDPIATVGSAAWGRIMSVAGSWDDPEALYVAGYRGVYRASVCDLSWSLLPSSSESLQASTCLCHRLACRQCGD